MTSVFLRFSNEVIECGVMTFSDYLIGKKYFVIIGSYIFFSIMDIMIHPF